MDRSNIYPPAPVYAPEGVPPYENQNGQILKMRKNVRRMLVVLGIIACFAVGGEIAGDGCISKPLQAISVVHKRGRLADIGEEIKGHVDNLKRRKVDGFLDNPRETAEEVNEIKELLDEVIVLLEEMDESGIRFSPAVLMGYMSKINSGLYFLEGSNAQYLYDKIEDYEDPGFWTRHVTSHFVDTKGIAKAGRATRKVRDKVREIKKLFRKLTDKNLRKPTNNFVLNFGFSARAVVAETFFDSAAQGFLVQTVDIQRGDQGEHIASIQRQLMKIHFLGANNDDGNCGRRTISALRDAREALVLMRELKEGDGDDRGEKAKVRKLQRYLIRAKCLPSGEADGSYGGKTSMAVLCFKDLF